MIDRKSQAEIVKLYNVECTYRYKICIFKPQITAIGREKTKKENVY